MRENPHHTCQEQSINTSDAVKKPSECERANGHWLFNFETGELVKAKCKAYKCPVCGPKKVWKLKKYIQKHVASWNEAILWTFTISDKVLSGMSPQEKFRFASRCWKTFRDLLYKNKSLSGSQKDFQYIKTVEVQENGSPHYHAILDRFVWQPTLNKLWIRAIQYNSNYSGTPGNANVSWENKKLKKKNVGNYITKYILKQIQDLDQNLIFRRWSKSGLGSIYPVKETTGDWVFLVLNLDNTCVTSVIEMLFLNREDAKKTPVELFSHEHIPKNNFVEEFQYGMD
jgi:hypothetical protein